MEIVCLDLEGVLVPEIWIQVAAKTRISDLRLTTRDLPDYDKLMRYRIRILKQNKIRLKDIQKVISGIQPLPGARAFLERLRRERQVIILSDTFYEFASPLMQKLNLPTLFCNDLKVDSRGFISGYKLRQQDGKKKAVKALRSAGFRVAASGDSFNDITMLQSANRSAFFNPPEHIAKKFPHIKVLKNYQDLYSFLISKK